MEQVPIPDDIMSAVRSGLRYADLCGRLDAATRAAIDKKYQTCTVATSGYFETSDECVAMIAARYKGTPIRVRYDDGYLLSNFDGDRKQPNNRLEWD